jgi:hypothetical protein
LLEIHKIAGNSENCWNTNLNFRELLESQGIAGISVDSWNFSG